MMNNEMMRQLQARMMKIQEDLAAETVEASAGGGAVSVTISEIGMGPALDGCFRPARARRGIPSAIITTCPFLSQVGWGQLQTRKSRPAWRSLMLAADGGVSGRRRGWASGGPSSPRAERESGFP